jgi:putative oxidoreductase
MHGNRVPGTCSKRSRNREVVRSSYDIIARCCVDKAEGFVNSRHVEVKIMSSGTHASPGRGSFAGASPDSSRRDAFVLHYGDPLLLLGRILLGGIFVLSGYGKLMGLAAFAASLEKNGVPYASVMAPIGASVEFFGGLAIVLGIELRYAAALMIAFGIVATLISHRFWEFQDAVRQMQKTQFSKNVAIIGGFVLLLAAGGGRLALDRLWRRH